MSNRKSLLIGVDKYGSGFESLDVVNEDLQLMRNSLTLSGYEIMPDIGKDLNATALIDEIRKFCHNSDQGDILVIYFTGHGIRIGNEDYIVPHNVSWNEATQSSFHRVPTDLSPHLSNCKADLIIFMTDACRNEPTKGGWTDLVLENPKEERFVRFLGCGPGEVCQIVDLGSKKVSLFTLAITQVLEGTDRDINFNDFANLTQQACEELRQKYNLRNQAPRYNAGELPERKIEVLNRFIFGNYEQADLISAQKWPFISNFDPSKFYCTVILSECRTLLEPQDQLYPLVRTAIAKARGSFWSNFVKYAHNQVLINGSQRKLPEDLSADDIVYAPIQAEDVFNTENQLAAAIRAVCEADLAVFDITDFEPGVLVLLGIRSAVRRGVTICSLSGWQPGQSIDLPFNLQDLSINSHEPPDTVEPGIRDIRILRLVSRIKNAFKQLTSQPTYLDLPGYDNLRRTGPDYEAYRNIPITEQILVLCSFKKDYTKKIWNSVRNNLEDHLSEQKLEPEILRLIDYQTPRLVSQSLYDAIRRTSMCIVDWTDFSPSVFLELGTRLAASELAAIHIIENSSSKNHKHSRLKQVGAMFQRFKPHIYSLANEREPETLSIVAKQIIDEFRSRHPEEEHHPDYNVIHRKVLESIDNFQPSTPPIYLRLKAHADALDHPEQERVGRPQVLFYQNSKVKKDAAEAALSQRLAAWLYLEYRLNAGKNTEGDELKNLYNHLGNLVVKGLYGGKDPKDKELAIKILNSIKEARKQ